MRAIILLFTACQNKDGQPESSKIAGQQYILAGKCQCEEFCNAAAKDLVNIISGLKEDLEGYRSFLRQTCAQMKEARMNITVQECHDPNF